MKKLIALSTLFIVTACGDKNEQQTTELQTKSKTESLVSSDKLADKEKHVSLPKADEVTVESLKQQLDAAHADVSCDTSDQCYVIPTGVNPCGGASGYSVLSAKTSNKDQIVSLSAELMHLEKGKHALEGTMGICQHLFEPKAMCQDNKCIATVGSQEVY